MSYIDIAEAKKQIIRISKSLNNPLLLIGGLAVNQYVVTRISQDIDLVCDYETSRDLVVKLYPSNEWTNTEINEDEYRPSFIIQHKLKSDYPIIKFGPKIVERGSYKYLDWDALNKETARFKYNKIILENIHVPTVEALCYMKIVSFIGRSDNQIQKLRQDLWDIRELMNIDSFRLGVFLNLIIKNDFALELESKFHERLKFINETLDNCNIGTIVKLFSKSIMLKNNIQINSPFINEDTKVNLVVFDLDGTLIKGIRHSWTLLWNELNVDNKAQLQRKEKFCKGELSYLEWTRLDCDDLIKLGLNKSHFRKIVKNGKCSLTKNLVPAIQKLRENGIKTAIISGGIDALLYELLPEAQMLFDEIFINRFIFNNEGKLLSINATEYDWDDNKLGVVGKNRGLERICEKYDIPIEKSVFVGDDLNDFKAMRKAGTKIFYCGDCREFKNEQLPMGIILIPENDLMKVVDKVLSLPTEDVAIE